jgi:hypothetical protein
MRSAVSRQFVLRDEGGGAGLIERDAAGGVAVGRDQDHARLPRQLCQLTRQDHAVAIR